MGEQAAKEYKNTRETKVRDFGQENVGKGSKPNSKKPQRTRDDARKRNNAKPASRQKAGNRKSGSPRPTSDNKKAGERKGNNRERNDNRGKGKAANHRSKQGGKKREQRYRNNNGPKNRDQSARTRQSQFEDNNKTEQVISSINSTNRQAAEMESVSAKQVVENSAKAPQASNQPDLSKETAAAEKKSTITAEKTKLSQAKRKSKSWLEMTASELRQENEYLEEEIEELIESFKTLKL
ncbi:MAG: hypothetical protein Q4E09_04380 [Eubacteriales bacterium]|nr:hypothetical protein [Eubacteriales bacterium]